MSGNWDISNHSFDWNSVDGFEPSPKPTPEDDLRPFLDAVEDLKPSYLSRLTRIVRDWADGGEEQPTILVAGFAGTSLAHEDFHFQLASAKHCLLDRGSAKDLWAWFVEWRDVALEVLDPRFSGRQVLDILRRALSAARRRQKPPAPQQRYTSAERLLQLAESIIPHAPPRRPSREPFPSEAG